MFRNILLAGTVAVATVSAVTAPAAQAMSSMTNYMTRPVVKLSATDLVYVRPGVSLNLRQSPCGEVLSTLSQYTYAVYVDDLDGWGDQDRVVTKCVDGEKRAWVRIYVIATGQVGYVASDYLYKDVTLTEYNADLDDSKFVCSSAFMQTELYRQMNMNSAHKVDCAPKYVKPAMHTGHKMTKPVYDYNMYDYSNMYDYGYNYDDMMYDTYSYDYNYDDSSYYYDDASYGYYNW